MLLVGRLPLTCDIDFLLSVSKVSHCLTSSPTPKAVISLHRMRNVWMLKVMSSTVGYNPPRCVGCWIYTCITLLTAQSYDGFVAVINFNYLLAYFQMSSAIRVFWQ